MKLIARFRKGKVHRFLAHLQLRIEIGRSPVSVTIILHQIFRQGSLIVLFELEVDKRQAPAVDNLEARFKKTLQEEIEKGTTGAFRGLKIDENALQLTGIKQRIGFVKENIIQGA